MNDSTQLSLRTGYRLQWEPRQSAWVLLFPEGMVVLSETAHLILDLCKEPVRLEDLINQVQDKFPGEPVSADVREFVRDAYEQQWLEHR